MHLSDACVLIYYDCKGGGIYHDCFMELYDRMYDKHKEQVFQWLDPVVSTIRTDYVGMDGKVYYDHTVPFDLWKIDSWRDKEYWDLLQMLGKGMKAGVGICEWQYLLGEYKNHHKENE